MEHIYQNFEGWFDYEELYSRMVKKFPNGSKFVEVGSYKGKSASYLAVEILNSNKDIHLYCVDDHSLFYRHNFPGPEDFEKNMKPFEDIYSFIKMNSIEASKQFENNSLDFIFIDADHSYEAVKSDIEHWFPKLKKDGVIAGHDYQPGYPDVIKAVNEKFTNVKNEGCSWIIGE